MLLVVSKQFQLTQGGSLQPLETPTGLLGGLRIPLHPEETFSFPSSPFPRYCSYGLRLDQKASQLLVTTTGRDSRAAAAAKELT